MPACLYILQLKYIMTNLEGYETDVMTGRGILSSVDEKLGVFLPRNANTIIVFFWCRNANTIIVALNWSEDQQEEHSVQMFRKNWKSKVETVEILSSNERNVQFKWDKYKVETEEI